MEIYEAFFSSFSSLCSWPGIKRSHIFTFVLQTQIAVSFIQYCRFFFPVFRCCFCLPLPTAEPPTDRFYSNNFTVCECVCVSDMGLACAAFYFSIFLILLFFSDFSLMLHIFYSFLLWRVRILC